MPFPVPRDPDFIKEIIEAWLQDVDDRLEMQGIADARESWKTANALYLSLPAGSGDDEIESSLLEIRVKLE